MRRNGRSPQAANAPQINLPTDEVDEGRTRRERSRVSIRLEDEGVGTDDGDGGIVYKSGGIDSRLQCGEKGIVRCISTLQRRRVGRSPQFVGRRHGRAEVAQLSVLRRRSTTTPKAAVDPGLNTTLAGAAQQFLQIGFVATF